MANLFRADYTGWRNVAGLAKVTAMQKFGNHTLYLLDYDVTANQRYLLPPENTPFQIRVGQGPLNSGTVYGYVNHYEDVIEGGSRHTRLVGLGTSKVMNSSNPTTWMGSSRTGILRDIGARHRFRTVTYSHPEVLDSWSTGILSDFKAANALAEQMGFRLWIDGPTMWVLDPQLVLASASLASTKVVRGRDQQGSKVFKGSNVPGSLNASKRVVQYGLNPHSNELIVSATGDRNLPVEMLSKPVSSYSEANYVADARLRASRDQEALEVTFDGDMNITPGSPIRMDATANPKQQGVWLVNEATHVISGSAFTTRVSATRESDRLLTSRVPDRVRQNSVLARAVVRNGSTWEAEVQERIDV